MIVITGPGRSGTSVIARLYAELGFDPGGCFEEDVNAGLENEEVVSLNRGIASDLGVSLPVPRPLTRHRILKPVLYRVPPINDWARRWQERSERIGLVRWDQFDSVVARYRERLVEVSARVAVTKDPRFCWTLGVWLAAGCDIDHMLVFVRSAAGSARSRRAVNLAAGFGHSSLTNVLNYGLALCVSSAVEHDLRWSLVRFPDLLREPHSLYQAAVFPRDVTWEDFVAVFERVVDQRQVHHGR